MVFALWALALWARMALWALPSPLVSNWLLTEWQIAVLNYFDGTWVKESSANFKSCFALIRSFAVMSHFAITADEVNKIFAQANFLTRDVDGQSMKLRSGRNFSQSFLGSA